VDSQLYERWRGHPVREILRRAAEGDHIYPDQIADLELSKSQERALQEAIERVTPKGAEKAPAMGVGSADHLSSEIVAALDPHHETRQERMERRAHEGDPDALAAVKAREEANERLAERIYNDAHGIV
jgi:hypothetical protein